MSRKLQFAVAANFDKLKFIEPQSPYTELQPNLIYPLVGMGNPTSEHQPFAFRILPAHKPNDFTASPDDWGGTGIDTLFRS